MEDHRQWLRGLRCEHDVGALDQVAAVDRAGRQFVSDQRTKSYALPMAATEQGVSIRQRTDAAVEHLKELVRRPATLAGSLRDRRDAGKHILHAMVELGDQQVLVVLRFSP